MTKSTFCIALTIIMLTGCKSAGNKEKTNNTMENSDNTLRLQIVRQFNVAPEVVFDVFTKPEAMRVWWTDDTHFDIDLRVGGKYSIRRKEGETEYVLIGEYLEIEKPNRLKYSYAMPQFSPNSDTIIIDIVSDNKNGSIVTFVQTGVDIASELRELPRGSISESEKGFQHGFDLMEQAWKKQ